MIVQQRVNPGCVYSSGELNHELWGAQNDRSTRDNLSLRISKHCRQTMKRLRDALTATIVSLCLLSWLLFQLSFTVERTSSLIFLPPVYRIFIFLLIDWISHSCYFNQYLLYDENAKRHLNSESAHLLSAVSAVKIEIILHRSFTHFFMNFSLVSLSHTWLNTCVSIYFQM